MDKGGQTISATEFAALTGVSRERLRTWERRHDFPVPVRLQGGARRYAREDITRVIAVRRAVESGVPIPAAVAAAERPLEEALSPAAQAALAADAPVAVVALSGPDPLRVEYVNELVKAHHDAPRPGDDLIVLAPWFDNEPGADTIRRLFAGDGGAAACEHPDWTGGMTPGAHSIAFRLPHESGQAPLVGLIGVDTSRERQTRERLTQVEAEHELVHAQAGSQARLAEGTVAVAELFRRNAGTSVLAEAATILARRLGAVDAGLAPSMSGALVLGRSSRGLLGPEMVTVARFEELSDALRDGEPGWVSAETAAAFGAPKGMVLLVVGLLAAGETLGALLCVFEERSELTAVQRDLLRVVAAILALALVRERLVGELQDP